MTNSTPEPPTIATKRCNKCGALKDVINFSLSVRQRDGKQPTCKQCCRSYRERHTYAPCTDGYQECRICHASKHVTEFPAHNLCTNGRSTECRVCRGTRRKSMRHPAVKTGIKRCSRCHTDKPISEFSVDRRASDGHTADCRQCKAQYQDRYRHSESGKIVTNVNCRNRRARKRSSPQSHTASDIIRQGKVQKWKCWWCGQSCKGIYHIDHVIPLARGGHNGAGNLVVTCPTCNLSKFPKTPDEFAGRLL